jgi:tetratricopeptide (TPR) repeat protein
MSLETNPNHNPSNMASSNLNNNLEGGSAVSDTDKNFELGKLHCDRGDFEKATEIFKKAAESYYKAHDFSKYLKCQNLILRMCAEREQYQEIQVTKEKLQDLVLKEGFELTAKTYYTLALCASYKGQNEIALEYLQKSLAIALANDNKEDICYAISGLAIIYKDAGKYEEALKEIYNLQIFFQVLDIPELKISSLMINSMIFTEMKKYDQAIDLLWQAYDLVKKTKILTMHIALLANMGWTYARAGDKDMARMYLNLANQSCDAEVFKATSKIIKSELELIGENSSSSFDLLFDLENHTVIEKKIGKIDFKNQFILLDLLKLFVQNQGQVYSKEFLVEKVWKQNYDPEVHDNKIYVTIKRLRKMIEPDYDKPKYIFRAKNGYFMNKTVKVHIEDIGGA